MNRATRRIWAILRLGGETFSRIDGTEWAGAFAFNAFFSLFPLVVLLVTGLLLSCVARAKTVEPQEWVDPATSAAGVPTESERPAAPDPVEFFRRHFFPFEPFYFIAGTESTNATFQISLKYQLLTGEPWLATKWSGVTNLSVAYTQTGGSFRCCDPACSSTPNTSRATERVCCGITSGVIVFGRVLLSFGKSPV